MRSSDWSSDVCSSDLSSPVAAATSAADERRERPELEAGDDEREGEGAALAERSDHKPRTPRQPKEANDAPAIIIQGRRGIVLSGQCINLGLVELPANLRGVWINVSERKALKPPSCLELGIRGDG